MFVRIVKKATPFGVKRYYYLCRKYRDENGKPKDEIIRRLQPSELDSVQDIIKSIKNESSENVVKEPKELSTYHKNEIKNLETRLKEMTKKASDQYKYILELEEVNTVRFGLAELIHKIDLKEAPFNKAYRPQKFSQLFLTPLLTSEPE